MKQGTWKKGTQTITGFWEYHWPSDIFIVTRDNKKIIIHGDLPNWGGWKLVS